MNLNVQSSTKDHAIRFSVSLARTTMDLDEALRLRYRVFVQELGAGGAMVDHAHGIETDRYDAASDHLVLRDITRPEGQQIVGVYRLLSQENAVKTDGFYTESEFDLSRLKASKRRLLELGRSCIAPEYRGTTALLHLWQAVGRYVSDHDIEILFGTASFCGTDSADHAAALSFLHREHLAPIETRPVALGARADTSKMIADVDTERKDVMRTLPALIKSYLRMGGCVGEGAFVDHTFNTTDVCMIVDVAKISARQRALYTS